MKVTNRPIIRYPAREPANGMGTGIGDEKMLGLQGLFRGDLIHCCHGSKTGPVGLIQRVQTVTDSRYLMACWGLSPAAYLCIKWTQPMATQAGNVVGRGVLSGELSDILPCDRWKRPLVQQKCS